MTLPVYLLVTWGVSVVLAKSHVCGPPRRWLCARLRAVDRWAGVDGPWLARGPECPFCVSWWVGLGLVLVGLGPDLVPGVLAPFLACGVVFVAWAVVVRVTAGVDF